MSDHTLSRRTYLTALSTGTLTGIAGCLYPTPKSNGNGNNPNLGATGDAGGVGSGYAHKTPTYSKEDATHIARDPDQLTEALQYETPRIWIPADVAIDYSGNDIALDKGWIASTRTINHPGGMIYTNTMGNNSPSYKGGSHNGFIQLGQQAELNGIRLRGPTSNVHPNPWYPGYIPFGSGGEAARRRFREKRHSRGVTIVHGDSRIANCEIYGWSTHGITVNCPRSYGVKQKQSYPRIINSSIHDCGMSGHGYGIHVMTGHPLCNRLYINGTRHSIAGYGHPDGGYTLANSFIGPANSLFQLDMHYIGENDDGTSDPQSYKYRYHAGELIRLIGVTVSSTHVVPFANFAAGSAQPAVVIGGLPTKGVQIQGCKFAHPAPGNSPSVFSQGTIPPQFEDERGPHGFVRFNIKDNTYGVNFPFKIGNPSS